MNISEQANHRWILDVSKNDRASDVAARTIQLRLESVGYYLPLAATRPEEDIEYVHQLRVATRRAVAAVSLYRDFLPKEPRQQLCRELKQIRRAAGAARDCDVLIERQERSVESDQARKLLDDLCKKRREAQEPLREVYHSSVQERTLKQLLRKNLQEVEHRSEGKKSPRFTRWARRRLRATARKFFAAEPNHLDDLDALHEFRICGKDLRYAMELLAAAFPDSLRKQLYPLIEQLQDRLGAINDHAVAIERFRKWREESCKRRRRKRFKKLIHAEEQMLSKSLWEFAKWWTPRRSKWIQRRFRAMVNGKT